LIDRFSKTSNVGHVNTDALLREVQDWAGVELPEEYVKVLRAHGGQSFGASVLLYGFDDLLERNVTFEVKTYCPGFLSIGDDGGGRAIVIPLDNARCRVFLVDHGSMDPGDFAQISGSPPDWVASGCLVK
jgi:hypothetical protein